MIDGLIINKIFVNSWVDDDLEEFLSDLLVGDIGIVLTRDEDGMDSNWDQLSSLVGILDGNLGLGVWSNPGEEFLNSALVDSLAKSGGEEMGEWHELWSFISGVSNHETLISGTDILILLLNMDGISDLLRLLVNGDDNCGILIVESLSNIIITDFLDSLSGDLFNLESSLRGDFSENHT